MKTLDEKIAEVSPARRNKIEDRAAQLAAEEVLRRQTRPRESRDEESSEATAAPVLPAS